MVDPSEDQLPAGLGTHVELLRAPTSVEKVPALQLTHVDPDVHVPAGQGGAEEDVANRRATGIVMAQTRAIRIPAANAYLRKLDLHAVIRNDTVIKANNEPGWQTD